MAGVELGILQPLHILSRRDEGAEVERHGGYKAREDGRMGKTKVEPTEEPEAGGSV